MDLFLSQATIALFASHIIEWLKGQHWFPFAKYGEFWLNAVTAAIAAAVSAGAVQYTYESSGAFTMSGNVYSIAALIWKWVEQYSLQHILFKTTIEPPPTPTLTQAAMAKKEEDSK